jgi:hypothetical protein
MTPIKTLRATCVAAFGLLPVACAQQPQPAATSGMSNMSSMPGMAAHDMAGMDMQTMMNHCAQMRQATSQGKQLAPDMQTMMAQCDQMDRGMTMAAPAPAATLSR